MKYDVSVQMVEIYNEQVRDLLRTDASNKKYPFLTCFFYIDIVHYIVDVHEISVWEVMPCE